MMGSVLNDVRLSRRHALQIGVTAAAASLLAACSSAPATPASASPTSPPKAAATTAPAAAPGTPASGTGEPVTVGATAIIASAGLFVGIERGYFRQQGLDIQTTIVANSNDTLPLVATGKMDVANNAV